ncbi:oxygenase MpaB family protein [Arthrobacter sp. BF1]|uniref:oxygenase MpaB family protein n=1 Tax=Arthrobacter sp. BF1 TaxID=2821145 RepID=UPI001C4EE0E3|nr:oxygenase MpaB family protein [Arthrobacter sp. BF1]
MRKLHPRTLADVAPEAVLLAGAGRAVLLQLANPAVGHGVADHSSFATDPLKRLHGTLSYIYALSNGTPAQRRSMQRQVQRAHLPVKAAGTPRTPAYDASDPQLQLWVAATLYESALQIYDAVFPVLSASEAESVYQSYAILGTALGMPADLWPRTRADFAVYWAKQVDQLSVDLTVRGVAAELLAARQAPWGIRVLMPLARFLTAGQLPPTVRDMYGFAWSPRKERLLNACFRIMALLVTIAPKTIRHAPMRFYLRRIPD